MSMQKSFFNKDPFYQTPVRPDFSVLSDHSSGPYSDPILNSSYELMFCDRVLLYRSEIGIPFAPWDVIFNNESSNDQIRSISQDASFSARSRLIAHQLLAKRGLPSQYKDVLGVVVEVNLKQGLDVLAVYADGTIRFINHKERQMIWETSTSRSEELVKKLFKNSNKSMRNITWNASKRGRYPVSGKARISFLCGHGIHSMEADMHIMRVHEYSCEVMKTAIELMLFLTDAKFRKYGMDAKKAVFKNSSYISSN